MSISFEADLLTEPATMRDRFTPTGLVSKQWGGGARFQVKRSDTTGEILIWTVGPLGWWHDFQTVDEGTSFDGALARTYIPRFYGWKEATHG